MGRLIKYTGYGNAAGLLAHRGLMMGHPVDHVSAYSSDSSDSETDEYKEAEHRFSVVKHIRLSMMLIVDFIVDCLLLLMPSVQY